VGSSASTGVNQRDHGTAANPWCARLSRPPSRPAVRPARSTR